MDPLNTNSSTAVKEAKQMDSNGEEIQELKLKDLNFSSTKETKDSSNRQAQPSVHQLGSGRLKCCRT